MLLPLHRIYAARDQNIKPHHKTSYQLFVKKAFPTTRTSEERVIVVNNGRLLSTLKTSL